MSIPWRKALSAQWNHLPESSSPSSWLSSLGTGPSAAIPFPPWQHVHFSMDTQPLETWAGLSPPILPPEPGPGVSSEDGTSAFRFSLTHKGKHPPHVGSGLLQKTGVCFMLSPLPRSFKRLHLFGGHRIIEWVGLQGSSGSSGLCSSRIVPEHMAQDFDQTILEDHQ